MDLWYAAWTGTTSSVDWFPGASVVEDKTFLASMLKFHYLLGGLIELYLLIICRV